MFHSLRLRSALATLLSGVALAATLVGCSGGSTAPRADDLRVHEVILQDGAGNVMYTHYGHWHGAPVVPLNDAATLRIWYFAEQMGPDDHDAPPREQWLSLADKSAYDVRAVVEDPTLASWSGDRTSGRLAGLREGASRISFVIKRGTTTVHEAPPLNFRVVR
jgi:hypothetical protein